ncbi:MAG: hypothetical protein AABY15_06870 [Nanoarchaeota archaeon]
MSDNKTVEISIVAKVTTKIQLAEGETIEDLKNRNVDIYLHAHGKDGHIGKIDLGGDAVIEIIK